MSKILFIVGSMQEGGAQRVASLLCNHWVSKGHSVTLIPTFSGRGICVYPLDSRVNLDYLSDRIDNKKKMYNNKIGRILTLRRAIYDIKPDVIISFLSGVNVATLVAAIGSGIPVFVSERSYPPRELTGKLTQWLRILTYPLASAVVMQTDQGLEWLRSTSPQSRGVVIPNPIVYPLPMGKPVVHPNKIIPTDCKVLLAVGRLSKEKRFNMVIDAFSMLADKYQEWNLVIIGEGSEHLALEAQIDALSLAARVHLPGRVGNVNDWYIRSSLFVMNSNFEGFPNALIEAMSNELPVVSIDCDTGPRDIINKGVDGLLVSPNDGVNGLVQSIEYIIINPDRAKSMGKSAKSVLKRYSITDISDKWEKMMDLV
jgi:GalNAc-alpha-(1->4)-GalNAc-alpha-(1->3)-diNAcBac-PP-undecaprenol alpha-1,4-N-acetyl-D-galactosaminyltransferase